MTPFADEEDTRKVQTAVIGGAGSDDPVFLPYDYDEFDLFMRGRSRDDFYCGTLLGGCGKKLAAKRYTEKKCHFAHRPPVHCRRTANGESSADHLYIGQALTRWLARQNHRQAKASYRTVGDRPGGTVDFRLSGGRQLIRVQMARLGLHPWRQEAEDLARGADHVEWLFGPDSMLAFDRVESHGYAIRAECRTVGVTREVRIGIQLPGNTIEWTTLEECSLTPQGVVTPGLVSAPQGIVPRGSAEAATTPTPRLSFALADDTVAFTGAAPRADVQSPTGAPGSVYDADIQPLGSDVIRARIVLPHASTPPQPVEGVPPSGAGDPDPRRRHDGRHARMASRRLQDATPRRPGGGGLERTETTPAGTRGSHAPPRRAAARTPESTARRPRDRGLLPEDPGADRPRTWPDHMVQARRERKGDTPAVHLGAPTQASHSA
ncbi:competence protein CoiA family protein [Streptomyces sp. NPDC058874]|uniref:competence protein CoiA family protein n=1 Tax=unclassified Streptomyces TaxID=2593676 RepID=UPI0036B9E193